MKKFVIIGIAGILSVFSAQAQLGKQMSKYHEKDGVTVTLADKSLYGLYQRKNLRPETRDMLGQLEEINLLNIDLTTCPADLSDKIISQFRRILDNPDKYKLVKSENNGPDKQLIYIRNKNEQITDLAVWSQTPERIDLIELRGNVQPDQIALLPEALNLPGLHALAALAADDSASRPLFTEEELRSAAESVRNLGNEWREGFDNMLGQFFGSDFRNDSTAVPRNPFTQMDKLMGMFGDFKFPDVAFPEISEGDGNSVSSSVQIIEENGKTNLKIDARNTDILYVIDGQEAPKDSVRIPEKIRNAQLIPLRGDTRKTYLFITSQDKIGEFVSLKNGELTFRYRNQEFKYNLDKLHAPVLVIDGRPSAVFNVEPSDILQIRPLSQTEKEAGFFPDAEVVINTRYEF